MYLDTRTIIFLTALAALILGLAIWLTARSYDHTIRGMRRWALGSCAQSAAWFLFCGRDFIGDFWSITVSNTLLILSLAFFTHALRAFAGQRAQRWPYALAILSFALFYFFTLIAPDIQMRVLAASVITAILFFHCARVIGRAHHTANATLPRRLTSQNLSPRVPVSDLAPDSPNIPSPEAAPSPDITPLSYRLTRLGFQLCGAVSVLRAIGVFFVEQPRDYFAPVASVQGLFLLIYIGVINLTCYFLLMCSDKFHLELQRMARHDLLTGALNRGTIELLLEKEWSRTTRSHTPLSVLLLDMDSFKKINDTHGHALGDEVLIGCVRILQELIRRGDAVGRFGGEEFLVVLPNTDREEAQRIAKRLCAAIANRALSPSYPDFRATASIGVAVAPAHGDTPTQLLQHADTALYQAKNSGRNRVVLFEETALPS